MTATPAPNRREFLTIASLAAGALTLPDVTHGTDIAAAALSEAESLRLETESIDWLFSAMSEVNRQRAENEPVVWPEPENPFTTFLDNADEIFRASPRINTLTFNNLPSVMVGNRLDAARLAACPHLAGVRYLSFLRCFLEPADVRVLVNSPYLRNVRRLAIWMDDIGDEGARAIADNTALGGLRVLSLDANRIGPVGARALASSARFQKLEQLDLITNPVGDDGARALAESTRLPSLVCLRLLENGIGPEGARALAASTRLSRLEELGLAYQRIGPEGVNAILTRYGPAAWVEDDRGDATADGAGDAKHLRVIAGRVADDAARLAYADALAARAPLRAELIRLQVAQSQEVENDPLRHVRGALAANLLALEGDDVIRPLIHQNVVPSARGRDPDESVGDFLGSLKRARLRYQFHRGLIDEVDIGARPFGSHASALFGALPTLHRLRVTCDGDQEKWAKRVAASPHLAKLTALRIDRPTADVLHTLARSPHLGRVQDLHLAVADDGIVFPAELLSPARTPKLRTLRLTGLPDEALAALAAAGHLRRLHAVHLAGSEISGTTAGLLSRSSWPALHTLDLSQCVMDPAAVAALLAGPFPGLRSLHLADVGLNAEGLQAVLASAALPGLEVLDLSANDLGPEAGARLAAAPLAGVKLLNLARVFLQDDGLSAMARSPHLKSLEWLDVGDNEIGDAGVAALAASSLPGTLGNLEINENRITGAGAAALGRAGFANLAVLYLSDNPLGDDGFKSLSRTSAFANLRYLSINDVQATAKGVAAFAGAAGFPKLEVLILHKNGVEDEGAVALARSRTWTGLRVLGLAAAGVGNAGALALAAPASFQNLIGLDLQGNPIDDEPVEKLRERYGARVRPPSWSTEYVHVKDMLP